MSSTAPKESQEPKVYRFILANGALLEVPVFELEARGVNWMAVIDVDATLPGGLSRKWMPRGKGECFYTVEQLSLFDAVEFAADSTTLYNDKKRIRWYGVVVAKTDNYLLIEECASGARAVLRSQKARLSPEDRAKALEAERDATKTRLEQLENEIQELRTHQAIDLISDK